MNFRSRWRRFWAPQVAIAFDRDTLWSVSEAKNPAGAPDAEPMQSRASVMLEKASRKIIALGRTEGHQPGEAAGERIDYFQYGGISAFDVAEAAIRHELRRHRPNSWQLSPRVLVASPRDDVAKRAIYDAVIHAGARDVITIPRTMAATIGMGLDVQQAAAISVLYLDRDWLGIAFIARSDSLAHWEGPLGLDDLLLETTALAREPGDIRRRSSRAPASVPAELDWNRAVTPRLWRERYIEALNRLETADARCARTGPVYLTGPGAAAPGLQEGLAKIWGQPVIVKPRPEMAAILGCRHVLGELDALLNGFTGNPRPPSRRQPAG